MDKATVESVMALAFELARIREQHGAQSGMYLSEVRALRAEAECLAAQAAPTATSDGWFTKRPITIQAYQWFKNGDHPEDYAANTQDFENGELRVFTGAERKANGWEGSVVRYYRHPDVPGEKPCEQCGKPHHVHGWIDTLEQGHRVCPGDWIITGVKGERYPCKPDIFATTYAPAAQPSQAPVVQAVPVNCGTGYCSCIECVVDADRASSGATTPAAPFAKDSWQHAVDNQLVAFGRTSQEFANPHEALAWLAIMNMELGQSNAGATTQAVRMLTKEEPEKCYSLDEETFHNLGDFIDMLDEEQARPGFLVYEGESDRHTASHYARGAVSDLFERMGEQAFDDAGEHIGDWPDNTVKGDKLAELERLINDWLDANVKVHFYTVKNVRQIALTPEMLSDDDAGRTIPADGVIGVQHEP